MPKRGPYHKCWLVCRLHGINANKLGIVAMDTVAIPVLTPSLIEQTTKMTFFSERNLIGEQLLILRYFH